MGENLYRNSRAWLERFERRQQRRLDIAAFTIGAALAVICWLLLSR